MIESAAGGGELTASAGGGAGGEAGGEGAVPFAPVGQEFTVNSTYSRAQSDSATAELANGNFVVVWYEADYGSSANRLLKGQIYEAGGSPAGGELTFGLAGGHSPTVAGLSAQIYDDSGGALAPPFRIIQSTASAFGQNAPDVAALPDGGFAVVWEDERTSGGDVSRLGVHLRAFDRYGATVGADVLVNTATSRSQFDASIAVFADGGHVVTWSDTGAGGYIKGQLFDAAGGRIGTEFVISNASAVGSSVAVLEDGNFAVAWYEGGVHHVQRFTQAGTAVGSEVSVTAALGGVQVGPELAALADGGFAMSWTTEGTAAPGDGSGKAVALQIYDAGGVAEGGPRTVNGQTGGDQHDPAILGLAGGSFVVAWTDLNGTSADDDEVKAQLFARQVPNEAPRIVSNGGGTSAALGVDEGATAVTTVTATDSDGPDAVVYSITGGAHAALFAIDAATGALRFVEAPDHEAPAGGSGNFYTVVVAASDGALSSSQSIQILVGNVNEGVTIASGGGGDSAQAALGENAAAVTVVGAADGDGDPVGYSIEGGADASLFVIDAATGALVFVNAPDFEAPGDADGDNVYEVTVRATDGTLSDDQALSVAVANANEGVAITSGAAFSVEENGRAVAVVAAADLDGDAPTFSIAGGADAARFAIDAATGALSFVEAPDYEVPSDAGADNAYVVVVAATDGELGDTMEVTVTVTDGPDEAPTVGGSDGNDVLDLSRGVDYRASAGAGNDVFYYGRALSRADANDGGSGVDTLVLQGNYPGLALGPSSLVGIEGISLQGGGVTRWGQDGTGSYDYALRMAEENTAPGQQLRINAQSLGAGEDFDFHGAAESDGGRFLVYGGFGTDLFTGGSGNDIFFFEAGRFGARDRIDGGGGNDAVVISGSAEGVALLSATIASGTLVSVEALSFNGRFASDPSARPSYKVALESGNIASGARLIVNGSSLAAEQSFGFDGSRVADALLTIFGGAGSDRLTGGANGDVLYAGGGADLLAGGGGADVFQYRSASESSGMATDRIADFVSGTDRIDLAQIDANSAAAGDQAFAFVGSAAFSGVAGQLRAAFVGPNLWRVEGDVNGDFEADFVLEIVGEAGQPLGASDFVL
jgi:hypothetical protein